MRFHIDSYVRAIVPTIATSLFVTIAVASDYEPMPRLLLDVETSAGIRTVSQYPVLDSLTVDTDVVSIGEAPIVFLAHVSNTTAVSFPNARLDLTVHDVVGATVDAVASQTFSIPAGGTVVPISWEPSPGTAILTYQVKGALVLPVSSKGGLIPGGTFDSGCDGWALVNSNPPAWGTECDWGYLETYTTSYNTTDGNATYAFNYADLGGQAGAIDDLVLQFTAKYHSEGGIYGEGQAWTFVEFHDAADQFLGAAYQIAFNGGIPADDPTHLYSLVQQNVWIGYQQTLGSILDDLPGVPREAIRYVFVGTAARPVCGLPYCNPAAWVHLDDVALLEDAPLVSFTERPVVVTDLTADLIGDRRQMILDCFGGESGCAVSLQDVVPLGGLQGITSSWSRLRHYACAAGVHQAEGDDLRRDAAVIMAFTSVGTEMAAQSFNSFASPTAALINGANGPAQRLLECAQYQLSAGGSRDQATPAARIEALSDVGAEQGDGQRLMAIVRGDARVAVTVGGSSSGVSGVRHIGAAVIPYPDSLQTLAVLDDTLTLMETGAVVGVEAEAVVEIRTRSDGPVLIAVAHNVGTPEQRTLSYGPVDCPGGAALRFVNGVDAPDLVELDWTSDGEADTTLYPVDTTDVARPVGGDGPTVLSILPNPGNPVFRISLKAARLENAQVRIHDLRGRAVRTLHAGDLAAGTTHWTWDGADDAGRLVPTGVYLVRVSKDDRALRTRRLTLLR